jgi:predicted RNase H-like HicB family nuclease
VIESGRENFSAYVPDLPGCIATGKTPDDVLADIRGATEFHLEGAARGRSADTGTDYSLRIH